MKKTICRNLALFATLLPTFASQLMAAEEPHFRIQRNHKSRPHLVKVLNPKKLAEFLSKLNPLHPIKQITEDTFLMGNDAVVPVDMTPSDFMVEEDKPLFLVGGPKKPVSDYDPTDPRFRDQWGASFVKLGKARELLKDRDLKPVIVAVIDSGVLLTHADIKSQLWTNSGEIPNNGIDDDSNGFIDDFYGYDFGDFDPVPQDQSNLSFHGSHVAGIIAAKQNNKIGIAGIASNAKIMSIKMFDSDGFGWTSSAIESIEYAVNSGAKVINASWGGGGYSPMLEEAIRNASEKGVIFIAAAGNGGSDGVGDNNDTTPFYPANYTTPNLVSVGASSMWNGITSFSNFGARSVHVFAPGENIWSLNSGDGYIMRNGTSMAAPFVSGLAALMLGVNPGLNPQEMKKLMIGGSESLKDLKGKSQSSGRIDLPKTLNSVLKRSP